jgi:acetyl-CoA C-acetyltransferase
MPEAVIVGALRTPVGRLGGALAPVRPDDLMGMALKGLQERVGFDPAEVGDVIVGCANQAGEDNRNVGRMAVLLAGWPQSVPAATVNRLCGSGLEAIIQAARMVRLGEHHLVVAGGVESMSRAPYVMGKPAKGYAAGNPAVFDTSLGWRFPNPAMEELFPLEAMGCTAENLVESHGISREAQDEFAFRSHQKALAAQEAGVFADEILPVSVPRRKQDPLVVDRDEGPRQDTTLEKLATLRPVFRKGGSVTAGNSSTLNDGAAALAVCSEEYAAEQGWEPLARFVSSGHAGVDPERMGIGPVPATRQALERAGWSLGDLELAELNEAFAAQSLAVLQDLEGLDPERVNVHGGAIALGHPLGCSGAKITVTLLHELRRRGGGRALSTLCIGVGQGIAACFEAS